MNEQAPATLATNSSTASPVVTTVVDARQVAHAAREQAAQKIADLYGQAVRGPADEWSGTSPSPAPGGGAQAGEEGGKAGTETAPDTTTDGGDALSGVDENLLEVGRQVAGLSDDAMRAMATASPEGFKAFLNSAMSGWQRLAAGFQELEQRTKQAPGGDTEAPKPVTASERARRLAEKLGLDEEGTAELAALVEDGVRPLKKQVESLKGEREAEAREREGLAFFESVERAFASLGDDEKYGKGPIGSVTPAQKQARQEAAIKARAMVLGGRSLGQNINVEEAIGLIHRANAYNDMKRKLEAKAVHTARGQQGRFTIPPSRTRSGDGAEDRQVEKVDRVTIPRAGMVRVAELWKQYQGQG